MGFEQDFDKESFLKEGAIFGKEDQLWLLWGRAQLRSIRPEAVAISVADFLDESNIKWKLFPFAIQLSWEQGRELFGKTKKEINWQEASTKNFQTQFDQIQKWFKSKRVSKVVPYVFEQSSETITDQDIESMIANALEQSSGFLYGSWSNDEGFMGLTPEVLLSQVSKNTFETMALAGTVTVKEYEKNPEAFRSDPKEKVEHLKVIEDITNQLQKFGLVKISDTDVKATPHLVHLHTSVSLETKRSHSLESIVQSLHPTPALGCSPRTANQSIMKEFNEIEPRGVFGAPFGISFSSDSADFVVAIRNVIWSKGQIKIGSGCGVVEASLFDNEWLELKNKRDSVKKIFGIQ